MHILCPSTLKLDKFMMVFQLMGKKVAEIYNKFSILDIMNKWVRV
jgi:hypothetical protein